MMRLPDLDRARGMALRVLADRRITTLPVDPLSLLRQCRRTQVFTRGEAAEHLGMTDAEFDSIYNEAEAFTLVEGKGAARSYAVVYPVDGNPARLRFTLAHELGHIVLHPHGTDPAAEKEADVFASHLLCPRPVLQRMAQRFAPLTAEQAAAAFYVSIGCARSLRMDVGRWMQEELWRVVDEQLRPAVEQLKPEWWHGSQHVLPFSRTIESTET